MNRTKPGKDAALLKRGQRVRRKNADESGTVIEADGEIKVKWDGGRTSYFRRDRQANVRLKEPNK